MKAEANKGKVYIVGAGPGDPGLITLKAIQCIKKTDVILYDRLTSQDTLKYRKPGCILRYVGKAKESHTMEQERINALLLKYAKTKDIVVRLKGGDPFIFGRGAEEVLFLKSRGINCEVIPGVSSFYAAPEVCGIPLTHRGLASSFLVVTGHEASGKKSNRVDWKSVAGFTGTVVILMGKSTLSQITRKLIKKGMDKKIMCAVISKGTTKQQGLVIGKLCDITDKVRHLSSPAVVVIGEAVNLRDRLSHQAKPLSSRRYLLTASDDLNKNMAKKVKLLGAKTDCLPMIKISANKDYRLDRIILNIQKFDWLVFTSRHAVFYFLKRLRELGADREDLRGKIACVGPGTAGEFIKQKISPSLTPSKFTTRDLALRLKAQRLAGRNIALLRTRLKRDFLKNILTRAGAKITDCAIYNVEEPKNSLRLQKAILKKPDGILFLSPKSVTNFFNFLSNKTKDKLKNNNSFFSIGPVTTQALRQQGVNRVYQALEHTTDGLIDLCAKVANDTLHKNI